MDRETPKRFKITNGWTVGTVQARNSAERINPRWNASDELCAKDVTGLLGGTGASRVFDCVFSACGLPGYVWAHRFPKCDEPEFVVGGYHQRERLWDLFWTGAGAGELERSLERQSQDDRDAFAEAGAKSRSDSKSSGVGVKHEREGAAFVGVSVRSDNQ